ncbi:Ubiquinol-cytochrome-c reductase complex assembly factor 2 [Trichoplax sp. H2]|uniref:Mitochondrial nucleoid factor 1 n=1 Tax=Trichoplax adhaerens TaxID=10228 RepID=B3S1Y7_TRIAD|nr:hypothetical protein TRIADDRAFT_58385 [Trichoplax adhaerens]EDV23589.1 hypothetical protein TRIADDRAFT_58385 [Trichoplax adhaerens]RDD44714.1 Ubiquinol-cytochrome-c reductase complex assembly factor 2 [Trichoplax sp. H2]|eukprot:XP_002114499.1 hypothetical protein TRIADDRAFT_58385 [Trichoplax adhaerens]
MSAKLLRKFNQIMQQWPIDKTKPGRDLAVVLRDRIGQDLQNDKLKNPLQVINNLTRLNSNYYYQKYRRKKNTSFTGNLTKEYSYLLSTENQEKIAKKKKGFLGRFFQDKKE